VLSASASTLLLRRRRCAAARLAALLSVGLIVWGWFVAQYPRLIGPRLTLTNAAASPSALAAVCVAIALVLVAALPALYLLFAVFARPSPELTK
jgi:cytochrome bd ubiquinol oxidase subunit II